MTRILVQRGSSSSNQNRSTARVDPQAAPQVLSPVKDEEIREEVLEQGSVEEHPDSGTSDNKVEKNDDFTVGVCDKKEDEISDSGRADIENEGSADSQKIGAGVNGTSNPPPPPVPPPKTVSPNINSKTLLSEGSISVSPIGPSRRAVAWPIVSPRTSPSGSRPSSPRSRAEDGYNSADELNPPYVFSYGDTARERQFEIDVRRARGLEVKRMLKDGNCLFRAIADQVYGDPELFDLVRQLCIDYMERERDHFSQFITESFTSYCKRKRRDKVYGNNMEIQAFAEMYNRPIHIYSYSTEPINIFHGNYETDTPPIRLSFHQGNHYNSLVDPQRVTIGAGLGFSSLQGANINKDQVKAAIKAQQDKQIDNALLAEGQFYSDLELTEKEIERMVMEASRAEFKQQLTTRRDSSTSSAEPSSSSASKDPNKVGGKETAAVLSSSMQMVLSMGFSYMQVVEAYSIFGDDADSMVCYLLETATGGGRNRRKGKATE